MTAWNEATYPADSLKISDIPLVFRQLQFALSDLWEPEHGTIAGNYAASSGSITGFKHASGSAKMYHQNAEPTTQPGGAALDASDAGRLWWDANALSGTGALYFYDGSAWVRVSTSITPVGTIIAYASDATPAGWHRCAGTEIDKTLYSDLFDVIGHNYAPDPGGNNFTLPDFRGRVLMGYGTNGAGEAYMTSHAMYEEEGVEKHVLSAAEMPAHTHSISNWYVGGCATGGRAGCDTSVSSKNTGSAGSGNAHTNLQPSQAINYIIKW
jgi:microcystin-dependent protein